MQYLPYDIWRDIPWYEWLYMVSNTWGIKSIRRNIILSPSCNRYKIYILSNNWKKKYVKWHRIVAQVFLWLDIKDSNTLVCHKDDNPLNNNVDNLFLWTSKDNNNDMRTKGRHKILRWCDHWMYGRSGSKNPNYWKLWVNNSTAKKILCINTWKIYYWWWDVQRDIWINRKYVTACCLWYRRSVYWLRFSYI